MNKHCHIFSKVADCFLEPAHPVQSFLVWFLLLQSREDRASLRYKPTPWRPAEAVIPTMVATVEGFVNKDRKVKLQEVTNQFSIGKASHIRF